MSFFGYALSAVLLLLCSYAFIFMLVVANLIRQETALRYLKYSLGVSMIIAILLSIFGSMIVSIAVG